ncbi:rRNA maturation RNase YbeY [Candidatus Wolfebacteria bacterium]|nr:rRNA maturation RNase YbeY [Candidatus Wolfebacteria bacterium]
MNRVFVVSLDKKFRKFEKPLKSVVLKIFKVLKKDKAEADIYLIGDRQMRFLNKKFRGKDKTTTVLSFEEPRNFVFPPSKFKKIGEIYLNCEISNLKSQISNLLVHGLLHLFGYDHKKKNDRIKMEKMEQSIIKCLLPL